VTSVGANKDSWLLYPRVKGEIEEEIRKEEMFESFIVFRPALLITPRDERRMGEFVFQLVSPALDAVVGVCGMERYRSITVQKVARGMRKFYESRLDDGMLPKFKIVENDEIHAGAMD